MLAVNVLTLNAVIEQHLANQPLHLVSIDVEGMAQAVLQGLDLARYRPCVFIIEATLPGTKVPRHQGWEAGPRNAVPFRLDGVIRHHPHRYAMGRVS